MKDFFYRFRNSVFLIVISVIVGLVALLLVHLLPTAPMREHLYWSFDMIEDEFTDEVLVEGNNATLTGNFTDCLMLQHAVYSNDEHGILDQALYMYRSETYNVEGDPDGWWPGQSLKDYLEGTPQPREVTYARYWHGYLVVLKPLLLLTSFNTIRLLNSAIQLILTGWVIMEMCEKKGRSLATAFLISLPFMFFISTYSSLSLSICFYITLLTLLVQLKWDKQIYDKKFYPEFFLIVGILTSYFDFLTYPLVTLAYPLCVYFYYHMDDKKGTIFKKIFGYSVQWGIGYLGMWAGKWIVTDLLTESETIKDALYTVMVRTQSAENATRLGGFGEVVGVNMQVYSNWCYLLLALLIVVMFLLGMKKNGIKNTIKSIPSGVVFMIIALYPFAWYFLMQNHSEQHWQYTCRILAITVFAGVTALLRIVKTKET